MHNTLQLFKIVTYFTIIVKMVKFIVYRNFISNILYYDSFHTKKIKLKKKEQGIKTRKDLYQTNYIPIPLVPVI